MFNKFLAKIHLTSKLTRERLVKFVAKHRNKGLTLDIGCARAPYLEYFPNRIGFDIKPGPRVDVVGDAHNLPFENEKFDNILCTEVLEHLHSPELAISEMRRVLKKGGALILSTRFIFSIHDVPNDFYRYTKYGLRYLFKDWEILELEEEVSSKDTFAVLLQRMGYQAEFRGGIFTKFIIFFLARIITFFPNLIKKEFGNIKRSTEERNILTSGYYLVCKKN